MGFENGRLVRVTLHATFGNEEQVNTFHYDLNDAGLGESPNSPQELADRFRDDVRPHFTALYTSGATIQPVVVSEEKDPQNPLQARQEWTSGPAIPGSAIVAGELLPPAMCAVATLRSEHIGRRFRGRNFLGGSINEGTLVDGAWGEPFHGLWTALMDAIPRQPDLANGLSPSSANWVVYSRTQRAQLGDPYASRVISAVVSTKAHWLRSRDT